LHPRLLYVHLNRLIKRHDAEIIDRFGSGHGAAIVAQVHLEGM
jgi:phosphoketolase